MSATRRPRARPQNKARTRGFALAVQYGTRTRMVPSRRRLRDWAAAALETDAQVTLRLVGAREGRRLNREFRGRDYATNVLTFAYPELRPLAGDIVLCVPVIAREAREQGKALDAHFAHLVVHGMLHLQGYDHERSTDAERMEGREAEIVAGLGYADPYARRTA
ncbi:MAG TPA: rRNA maturation RNase YbeY [Burkholderiales bacterium]|nr:rRNA maturation RNase YbeY [Burkholderiales bacterium]